MAATKWDDIDLFMVTKRNRLWISALLTLVLVRLNKLLLLRPPHLSLFCLSYVHDEQGFLKDISKKQIEPSLRRELLKAKPVAGQDEYRRLLETNELTRLLLSYSISHEGQSLDPTQWSRNRISK